MGFSVDVENKVIDDVVTVEDRMEKNKLLALDNFFPTFFSILLPGLGRPVYAERCVDHLIKYCDMPIEIILHDDGAGKEKQQALLDRLSNMVSIMILNTSRNIGLAGSMNRCRKMASSKYIFCMNVDDYPTSGFLKKMKTALDLPYVGAINVVQKINGDKDSRGVYIAPDGTKIALARGIGHSLSFGVRSDAWDEIGGWDENVQTTASDQGFMGTLFGHGYFTVYIEGTRYNEQWKTKETPEGIVNNSETNEDYMASARFASGDNNCPRFPNFNHELHGAICNKRQEAIWHGTNDDFQSYTARGKVFPSWFNSSFCSQETNKLYLKNNVIDWEFAKKYGHDKWKNKIIKDFNLE